MKTFKLSPSSIGLMAECPRCFWLEKNGVWSRPKSGFPTLPTGMDRILKRHFDNFRDKGAFPPELMKSECDDGKCKLFSDAKKLKIWRSNLKGVEYQDKRGNILHGAVDNLLIRGKKLIVLDYKTRGFPCKDDTHEHYQLQLDIYNFLLRRNGYETEDYAFLLFYIPKEVMATGEVIFDTKLIKMKIDVKRAEGVWKKAIKLLDGKCPEKHKDCPWCFGVEV